MLPGPKLHQVYSFRPDRFPCICSHVELSVLRKCSTTGVCWLSPTLSACLRCRALIGTYLLGGFVGPDCAVLCCACGTAIQQQRLDNTLVYRTKNKVHMRIKQTKKGKRRRHYSKEPRWPYLAPAIIFFFGKICIFRSSHTVSIITKQQDTRLTADVIPPEPNLLSLRSLSSTKSLRSPECFRFNYFWSASPNSTPCLCLHPVKLGLYFRHPAPRNSCNYVVSLVLLRRVKGWHRSECEWLALSPLSPM